MLKTRVVINKEELRDRVYVLAKQIQEDYTGRSVTIISMLTGSFIFTADLIRHIVGVPMDIGMVRARSYTGIQSGPIEIDESSLDGINLAGQDILVVDDILDTGQTLHTALRLIWARGPRDVRTCVLLRKKGRLRYPIEPDYFGFNIEDQFVIGYGLDYYGKERNRPNIAVLVDETDPQSARLHTGPSDPALDRLKAMERLMADLRHEIDQLRRELVTR